MLVCALMGALASVWSIGGSGGFAWDALGVGGVAVIAASCLGTAVWEETFFRHLLPAAIAPQLGSGRTVRLRCALVCAGLFALLHATGGAYGAAWSAARFVQVALFCLVMAGVALQGRHGLAHAVGMHALYDFVSFVTTAAWALGTENPTGITAAQLPAESLLALASTPAGMLANFVVLVPLTAWAMRGLADAPAPS